MIRPIIHPRPVEAMVRHRARRARVLVGASASHCGYQGLDFLGSLEATEVLSPLHP